MRRWTLIALFLLCSVLAFAEEQAADKDVRPDTTTSEVKQKESAGQKDVQKPPTTAWPRPYKPSEEVRADSTVPFPTDI